jgi:branched-subunit amino acid aminotransferase/4-amino-4-deoxychorismate lyase
MKDVVIYNGTLADAAGVAIPALSDAALYGDGLFESFRTVGGCAAFLDRHLYRMQYSAEILSIPFPFKGIEEVREAIGRLTDECGGEVRMRLTIFHTGDKTSDWMLSASQPPPEKEFCCRSVKTVRPELACHKTLNYLENHIALKAADATAFDEVIFFQPNGAVLEGAMTSVFGVENDCLYTAPLDLPVLPGITRSVILELAREAGITCFEEPFHVEQLRNADEVILTNAVRGVITTAELDGRKFESRQLTERMRALYNEAVKLEAAQWKK